MESKPSYYAIIPASVRYNKNLTPNAKLLYGEITALCNEKGYCWANNAYFSNLYGVSNKSISTWIKSLTDCGYVKSEIIYKEGSKEIVNRYLRICAYPMEENVHTPMEEKVKDNTTVINNTINNKKSVGEKRKRFTPPTPDQVQNYCSERGNNVDANRFVDYYTSKGWMIGKNKMKDWKAAVRTWERTSKQTGGDNNVRTYTDWEREDFEKSKKMHKQWEAEIEELDCDF